MTLDSSSLVAILFAEAGYLDLVDRILQADDVRIGAPTVVETGIVFCARRGTRSAESIDGLLAELGVAVVAFGEQESRVAIDAFQRFGRGRHPAALNYGDCLAYATAAVARDTLLFVGEDFSKTDIKPAMI
jgi:ribonuclease VapC